MYSYDQGVDNYKRVATQYPKMITLVASRRGS